MEATEKTFRVFARKGQPQPDGDYSMDHSSIVYLMDKNGAFVEAFNVEVKGLRDKCEVWCHTCWGSPAAQRVASKDQSYKAALPYLDQLDVDVSAWLY